MVAQRRQHEGLDHIGALGWIEHGVRAPAETAKDMVAHLKIGVAALQHSVMARCNVKNIYWYKNNRLKNCGNFIYTWPPGCRSSWCPAGSVPCRRACTDRRSGIPSAPGPLRGEETQFNKDRQNSMLLSQSHTIFNDRRQCFGAQLEVVHLWGALESLDVGKLKRGSHDAAAARAMCCKKGFLCV